MLSFVRAGLAAALLALAVVPAIAAGKAFESKELDEAAIKLEAQIKNDAGTVTKTPAQLRRDADAAFGRKDYRNGMVVLGQLVATAPNDASSWLRLARTVLQIRPRDDRERALLLDRASTAAYIAYQRTQGRNEEADSLGLLGKTLADRKDWRPALDAMRLALDIRETADLRGQYEDLRAQHGFRLLDYSVDSDAISPRACFQFSETLPGRTDFAPFVAVQGIDKPAVTADDKQLCVEGLKHGEHYAVTLRAGLPSTVHETLAKSVDFSIFVRDRKPSVRFTGKAYVLPKTGQRGIPLLSVNTDAVKIDIYRVGDRNLIDTVLGRDFQRNLYPYEANELGASRGVKVWSGELAVEQKLNTEVTTAFPVGEAVGNLAPGVYAMTAVAKGNLGPDYEQRATQWFIVSDLGLTAYSTHDGIDVFVHSLASAEPKAQAEIRLMSRSNEQLAAKRTDANGFAHFEAGLTRGEGGMEPAAVIASEPSDYAFLSLKSPAFDLSDRGVAGREVPAGLDAFVYTERGVYRSGETVEVTALLRDVLGKAAAGSSLTLVMERPDGVEYRRALIADQGLGGRAWAVPLVASAMSGTWHLRAFTDPKRPAVGETTFLVEDYVPDRLEFDLKSTATALPRSGETPFTIDGHFLYGAPTSGLELSGNVTIARGRRARRLPRLQLRPRRRRSHRRPAGSRGSAGDRRAGQSELHRRARSGAGDDAAAAGNRHRRHGGVRRPCRRAHRHAADCRRHRHDRRQAGVFRTLARRRRQRRFRHYSRRARRQADGKAGPALRALQNRDLIPMVPAERRVEFRAGQAHAEGRRRHRQCRRRQAGAAVAAGEMGPLSSRGLGAGAGRGDDLAAVRRRLLRGVRAPTRPTFWRSRSTRRTTPPATP